MKGKSIDNPDLQQFYNYFESRMNTAFDRIDEIAQSVEATVQANTTAVNHNSRAVNQNARAVNHNSAAVRALINFLADHIFGDVEHEEQPLNADLPEPEGHQ